MRSDASSTARAALTLVHVIDARAARDVDRLQILLRAGVTALWLRDAVATGRALFDAATSLRALTTRFGVSLFIGDRVDVALSVGADGVQLGRRAVPAASVRGWYRGRIGVSCHDVAELDAAQAAGADHVIVSPVFEVPDKGPALGVDGLADLLRRTRLPAVALGGIDTLNVASVRALGVAGVAVARALSDVADPASAARALAGMTAR